MTMQTSIRNHPLVCTFAAAGRWLSGRLRRAQPYLGKTLRMDDGQRFEVFRHVALDDPSQARGGQLAVLVVRFEFATLSDKANRLTSLIPIPAITGFPGFRHKVWMVDAETGCWQGVYQWDSLDAARAYQQSFVFGVMNRRAVAGSLHTELWPETRLEDFLGARIEG